LLADRVSQDAEFLQQTLARYLMSTLKKKRSSWIPLRATYFLLHWLLLWRVVDFWGLDFAIFHLFRILGWISEHWVLQFSLFQDYVVDFWGLGSEYPFFQENFVMQSMAMQNLLSFFAICLVPHFFVLQDKEGRSLHSKASWYSLADVGRGREAGLFQVVPCQNSFCMFGLRIFLKLFQNY